MKECHGCNGKGWVELSHGQAVKCPVCAGAGKVIEQEAPIAPAQPHTPYPYPWRLYPWYPYSGDITPCPWMTWSDVCSQTCKGPPPQVYLAGR